MGDSISYILVQTMVKKALKDIKEAPERSLRNLVDLARQFADGRFQQQFFRTAQEILCNENGAYFSLLRDVVEHVEEERLLTFGMNIGYNSCTEGARIIRDLEARRGYNIPWAVWLQIRGEEEAFDARRYSDWIGQGKKLGIYTWLLFVQGNPDVCMTLMEEHPGCAFVLFFHGKDINDRVLEDVRERNNLMLVLLFDETAEEGCGRLREAGLLYSLYHVYTEKELSAIESGNLFLDMEQLHPVFSILIPGESCDEAARKRAYDALVRFRLEQSWRVIPWELYQDGLLVDQVISNDGCGVGVDANGAFWGIGTDGVKRCCGSMDIPLADLLRQAFPKQK